MRREVACVIVAVLVSSCAAEDQSPDPTTMDAGSPATDSGFADAGFSDAATSPDSGAVMDAEPVDTGPAADTWDNFAAAFFSTYCNGCHNGVGTPSTDYSDYDQVFMNRNLIRCGVAPASSPSAGCQGVPYSAGLFPVGNGPKPSDDERLRLVAWIDDGALRN